MLATNLDIDVDRLFTWLLRVADDHFIMGHRVSEWCGHAPTLEDELALPNIALDLLGQAQLLYAYAAEVEGKNRNEDQLAFLRLEKEYSNLLLTSRPNGDFAHTILKIFTFAVFMHLQWQALAQSSHVHIKDIAAKAEKESRYHVEYASAWVVRLGDGTTESTQRMVQAMETLAPYLQELFESDDVYTTLADKQVVVDPASLRSAWVSQVGMVFKAACLPALSLDDYPMLKGGRSGVHGEQMGYLLTELQYMQRTYPNMSW